MIIQRIRPLANDHPEDLATCKWSLRGSGLLQMIIQRIWPLANDHLKDPAFCKWSSGGAGLLQMIVLASLTIFPNKIWTLIIKIKPAKEEEKKRELWQRLDSAPTNPLTPKYEDVGVSKTQIVQLTHLACVLCFPSQYRLVAINVGSTNMIYNAGARAT